MAFQWFSGAGARDVDGGRYTQLLVDIIFLPIGFVRIANTRLVPATFAGMIHLV